MAWKLKWRRERDSNPRYAINVYTLSRGAPSATRPPLRFLKLVLLYSCCSFSFESGATLFSARVIRFAHPYLFQKGLLPSAMCSRYTRVSHSATSPFFKTCTSVFLLLFFFRKRRDSFFYARYSLRSPLFVPKGAIAFGNVFSLHSSQPLGHLSVF